MKKNNSAEKGVRFLNNALLVDSKILVISDIHIGFEDYALGENLFSKSQFREVIEKLDGIFEFLRNEKISVKKIIILGDLKHEFGIISDSEWRETLGLLDYLIKKIDLNRKKRNGKKEPGKKPLDEKDKIILIKGNHDNILGSIAEKRGVKVLNYYKTGNICFLHGDRIYNDCLDENDVLIMGHLHPAVSLYDEYKKEKFKCFLKGKWRVKGSEKIVYILPSFIPLIGGYDMSESGRLYEKNENGFSIVPDRFLRNFEAIIYNEKENKSYNFGKLRKLMKIF